MLEEIKMIKKISLATLFFFFPFCLLAETIILKSGKTIKGRIIEKTEEYIKIDFYGVPITYYFEEIESIHGVDPLEPIITAPCYTIEIIEIEELSDEAKPHAYKGFELLNEGKLNEALIAFNRAVTIESESPFLLYNLGLTYKDLGRFNEAISPLQKSVELDPNYSDAYHALGVCYFYIGETNKALGNISKAAELNPREEEYYNSFAFVYGSIGEHKKALSYLLKALEIGPDNSRTHYNLGEAYSNLGEYRKAIIHYEKAISFDSNYAKAYGSLGIVYYNLKENNKAKQYFLKAKELFQKQGDERSVQLTDDYLRQLR